MSKFKGKYRDYTKGYTGDIKRATILAEMVAKITVNSMKRIAKLEPLENDLECLQNDLVNFILQSYGSDWTFPDEFWSPLKADHLDVKGYHKEYILPRAKKYKFPQDKKSK